MFDQELILASLAKKRKDIADIKESISQLEEEKADLVEGKVPLSQLPDFVVADVVTVDTYADLPVTGDAKMVYNVTADPDESKNGAYKWIGTGYFKYTNEQNYYNVSIVGDTYTMGQLKETVDNINLAGQHVLFDLSAFIDNGYVCTVLFKDSTHCVIYSILNGTAYGVGKTFASTDLVSDYVDDGELDLFALHPETWTFDVNGTDVSKVVTLW